VAHESEWSISDQLAVQLANSLAKTGLSKSGAGRNRKPLFPGLSEWAVTGSNRRPPACKAARAFRRRSRPVTNARSIRTNRNPFFPLHASSRCFGVRFVSLSGALAGNRIAQHGGAGSTLRDSLKVSGRKRRESRDKRLYERPAPLTRERIARTIPLRSAFQNSQSAVPRSRGSADYPTRSPSSVISSSCGRALEVASCPAALVSRLVGDARTTRRRPTRTKRLCRSEQGCPQHAWILSHPNRNCQRTRVRCPVVDERGGETPKQRSCVECHSERLSDDRRGRC
jgi:hypothetical protein